MSGKKLEEMMKQIDAHSKSFYAEIIPVHENVQLRAFATAKTYGFEILKQKSQSENGLCYTDKGFTALLPKYRQGEETGWYETDYTPFKAKDGKLYARDKELLAFFPRVTIDVIESALEKGLQELDIYKAIRT